MSCPFVVAIYSKINTSKIALQIDWSASGDESVKPPLTWSAGGKNREGNVRAGGGSLTSSTEVGRAGTIWSRSSAWCLTRDSEPSCPTCAASDRISEFKRSRSASSVRSSMPLSVTLDVRMTGSVAAMQSPKTASQAQAGIRPVYRGRRGRTGRGSAWYESLAAEVGNDASSVVLGFAVVIGTSFDDVMFPKRRLDAFDSGAGTLAGAGATRGDEIRYGKYRVVGSGLAKLK